MSDIHLYDVLTRPVITEKTNLMAADNAQYTFEVDLRANKIQIKEAVEIIFDVRVAKVATMIMPAKRGQRGRKIYQRKKAWKKAVVTLVPGNSIDLFNL
ncbi:MAG: 50S ribosomal protein L23 [Anaerolineae bacterium]|nr:50S ribosomal protein L23 [Anaerolineae bacterium]